MGPAQAITVTTRAQTQLRPERNSYLNRPAKSVAQLLDQIRRDPEVADRFMRHFAMTKNQVIAFFSTLRVARLPREGVYEMYSVPVGGGLKMRKFRLRKGELVFVDRSGMPILRLRCGNPLTLGPNQPRPLSPDNVGKPHVLKSDVEVPTSTTPVELVTTPIPPDVPTELAVPPTRPPFVTPPSVVTPPPTVSARVPPTATSPLAGGAIAGLGAIAYFVGKKGGGGQNPPVPEPATLVLVGAAAAGVIRRRRSA